MIDNSMTYQPVGLVDNLRIAKRNYTVSVFSYPQEKPEIAVDNSGFKIRKYAESLEKVDLIGGPPEVPPEVPPINQPESLRNSEMGGPGGPLFYPSHMRAHAVRDLRSKTLLRVRVRDRTCATQRSTRSTRSTFCSDFAHLGWWTSFQRSTLGPPFVMISGT